MTKNVFISSMPVAQPEYNGYWASMLGLTLII